MGRAELKGEVTVFLSLVMMCIFALLCVLAESARTAGARFYLQTAVSSALDSVFSQYHRELWDSYRLLFAEYEDEEDLKADFQQFLVPYLEVENWYPMKLKAVSAEELDTVTDDNGRYLEQEILDYMKYGIWKMDFDAGTVDGLWEGIREAGAVKEVAGAYRGHSKEALALEKSLEAVSESLNQQKKWKQSGLSELRSYDGPGFRGKAEQMIRELNRLPGLVKTYRKRADTLAASLEKSRTEYDSRTGELSGEVQQLLDQEIRQYESYVAQDGERRREIEALVPWSETQAGQVRDVIEEAEEVERIIDEWESDEDDEEDDGPDLPSLWRPVILRFGQLSEQALSFPHGVKDKEKEGWLNKVEQMCSTGLLSLTVPEGKEISGAFMDLTEAPSVDAVWTEGGRNISLPDRLVVNEYCGEFLSCFLPKDGDGVKAGEKDDAEGKAVYEMEYLVEGKDTDEDNLSGAVGRLMAVREGLNLIHILSDSEKREEARNLALMISGAAGITPLVFLTAFFVMSVWALGEALMDVRGLLAGRRVMLLKGREDWTLQLEGLLAMGKEGSGTVGGGERGLGYLSWLKILLLMEDGVRQEYRLMDVIQMNIRRKQNNFCMRRGVYQVELKTQACGKHVFFALGLVDNLTGGGDNTYPMEAGAERVY